MPKNHRNRFIALLSVFLIFLSLSLLACPTPAGGDIDDTTPDNTTPDNTTPDDTTPDDITPDDTTPDNALAIDKFFWGGWLGIGSEATWYISQTAVLINGTTATYSASDVSSITLSGGTVVKNSDNVLRYNVSGSTVPLFLFRSSGATNSFNAAVKDSSGTLSAGRGIGSLGGIKVIVRNLKNPANRQELTTATDGGIATSETIIGDDYSITVPVQDKIPSAIEAKVTPLYNGQDLGVMDLINTGANFKMNLRTNVRPDLIMADGVTSYPVTVEISNVGNADLDEANYTISSPDGLVIASGSTTNILGTVFKGSTRTIALSIQCPTITTDWVDKSLSVQVTDGMATKTWTDQVSLRFLKQKTTFALNVSANSGSVNGLVLDPDGIPLRVPSGTTNLAWKPGVYTLAFGGGGTGSETKYGVGIDVAARTDWDNLTNTATGEPNNAVEQATVIPYLGSALQYLGAKDVDFYQFEIPIGFLDVTANLTPGQHIGAKSVTLTPNYTGTTIRYTKDFTEPSATNGTVWNGETISVAADEPLYLYAVKEHYWPKSIHLIERDLYSLDVAANLTPGPYIGAKSITLTPNYTGTTIRYTKDFTEPSATNGTVWNGETINIAADDSLNLYIQKDHYFPKLIHLIERPQMFTMVSIPAGSFHNGTSMVTLSAFRLSDTEITQSQYLAVMGSNPSYFKSNSDAATCSVENVSWYDALVFCNKLSALNGLIPVYSISGSTDPTVWGAIPTSVNATWDSVIMNQNASGYRLPTEAQWEYAARGGTTSTFIWGEARDDATVGLYAWYSTNSGSRTHAVAQKLPNAYGLYDMSGNVKEWCWDWSYTYPLEAQTDPIGAASGTYRVCRGGCWSLSILDLYLNSRGSQPPYLRHGYSGFRVALP